jgi:PncC family amidohydrolase
MAEDITSKAAGLVKLLLEKNQTLSVAESCTGGMIGKVITDISGSSQVFWGGFVLYSNDAKIKLAGVNSELLTTHGAVSSQTVEAMARGTNERCGTDYSIAVSGIAGPGGGTPQKPVGTVWIGLANGNKVDSRSFLFKGNREDIRNQTTEEALDWLSLLIGDNPQN